jgi:hypothetical protein
MHKGAISLKVDPAQIFVSIQASRNITTISELEISLNPPICLQSNSIAYSSFKIFIERVVRRVVRFVIAGKSSMSEKNSA